MCQVGISLCLLKTTSFFTSFISLNFQNPVVDAKRHVDYVPTLFAHTRKIVVVDECMMTGRTTAKRRQLVEVQADASDDVK